MSLHEMSKKYPQSMFEPRTPEFVAAAYVKGLYTQEEAGRELRKIHDAGTSYDEIEYRLEKQIREFDGTAFRVVNPTVTAQEMTAAARSQA